VIAEVNENNDLDQGAEAETENTEKKKETLKTKIGIKEIQKEITMKG